ncbi:hypothetical protein SISSUDRAFT_1062745 [Sistotremastrum suecicum HHB10207 ss-3]|uniref:Uncharacterized protein n=1 Tax=Sistotremastrum suecicum HHB10207 ss-3 TaxID=1314776 RepID=A0A166CIE8_9AGAM|nr:hypothetical protein SISSUDRAFT_1062745 [Sistotremastrum suecicum HHB10207 ss-3]
MDRIHDGEEDDDALDTTAFSISKRGHKRPTKYKKHRGQAIADPTLPQPTPSSDEEIVSASLPSSDLLKSIHQFASQYYTTCGQLSTRNHREIDRLQRQESDDDILSSPTRRSPRKHNISTPSSPAAKRYLKPRGRTQNSTQSETWQPNMHKAFDGSVLVCLGMIIQQRVQEQLAHSNNDQLAATLQDNRLEAEPSGEALDEPPSPQASEG